jgi:hypothetical protein
VSALAPTAQKQNAIHVASNHHVGFRIALLKTALELIA